MGFWEEVLCIWLAVILADPIGILVSEFLKDYLSHKFNWFKGYKATEKMADNVMILLKKLTKKKGKKRKAKQAIALIKEAEEAAKRAIKKELGND